MHNFVRSILAASVFTVVGAAHAQTHGIAIAVTPSNTSQCPTSNQYPVGQGVNGPLLYNANSHYGTVQGGYCVVPASIPALPSAAYAISCTPQVGGAAGFLFNPAFGTQTANGFTLYISYYLNNSDANDRAFTTANLGTIYVDCIVTNQ